MYAMYISASLPVPVHAFLIASQSFARTEKNRLFCVIFASQLLQPVLLVLTYVLKSYNGKLQDTNRVIRRFGFKY